MIELSAFRKLLVLSACVMAVGLAVNAQSLDSTNAVERDLVMSCNQSTIPERDHLVVLDVDPGTDDFMAILSRHEAGVDFPGYCVATYGNPTAYVARRNLALACALFGHTNDVSLIRGAERPYDGTEPVGGDFHGPDGIGGRVAELMARYGYTSNSVECLYRPSSELIEAMLAADDVTYIAVGPLTSLANMLDAEPDLTNHIRRVHVMGGGLTVGNIDVPGGGQKAEFNFSKDPEAVRRVFDSPLEVTLFPLDLTLRDARLSRVQIESLAAAGLSSTILDMLRTNRLSNIRFKESTDHAVLHDVLAALYELRKSSFVVSETNLVVDAYGRIIGSPAGRPVQVATAADPDLVHTTLLRYAQSTTTSVGVIVDTDIGSSTDDLFVLATLRMMDTNRSCRLLGVVVDRPCAEDDDSDCFRVFTEAFLHAYDMDHVPIGTVPQTSESPKVFTPYWKLAFPGSQVGAEWDEPPLPSPATREGFVTNAVTLYRLLLSSQPGRSVDICAVGFLTALVGLMDSPADDISPLTGLELIAAKVRTLRIMACSFDGSLEHPEYNVWGDVPSASKVFNGWPGKIVVTPYEVGSRIYLPRTKVLKVADPKDPICMAYTWWDPDVTPGNKSQLMWDVNTVYGLPEYGSSFYVEEGPGYVAVGTNETDYGYTTFYPENSGDPKPGRQTYVQHLTNSLVGIEIRDTLQRETFGRNSPDPAEMYKLRIVAVGSTNAVEGGFVEICNRSEEDFDLSGCHLTLGLVEDSDIIRYDFPSSTLIRAGETLMLRGAECWPGRAISAPSAFNVLLWTPEWDTLHDTMVREGWFTEEKKQSGSERGYMRANGDDVLMVDMSDWTWQPLPKAADIGFETTQCSVLEGGAIRVFVNGGSSDRAMQATVTCQRGTGNCAAAYVGGKRVSFPLTLRWTKGDLESKEILFQTSASRQANGDLFFTLQLGAPVGGDVSRESSVCTVTIEDAQGGGVGKRSVRALAWPANGGVATGSGTLANERAVRTLVAKKASYATFAGWYRALPTNPEVIDLASPVEPYDARWPDRIRVGFGTENDAGTYFAYFTNVLAVAEVVEPKAFDAEGRKLAGVAGVREAQDGVYKTYAGVRFSLPVSFEDASGKGRLRITNLPAGLSLVSVDDGYAIAGVPTASGVFDVRFVASNAAGSHETTYSFVVDELPANAVGTFYGIVHDDEGDGHRPGVGSVTFTAGKSGALSAQVMRRLAGQRRFSAKGYDYLEENLLSVVMTNASHEVFEARLSTDGGVYDSVLVGTAFGGDRKGSLGFYGETNGTFKAVRNAFVAKDGEAASQQVLAAYLGTYASTLYATNGVDVVGTAEFRISANGRVYMAAKLDKSLSGTMPGGLVYDEAIGLGGCEAALRSGVRLWSSEVVLDFATRKAAGAARYQHPEASGTGCVDDDQRVD